MNDAELIMEKIPVGHKNAITREMLHVSTGMSDRRIRKAIHEVYRMGTESGEEFRTCGL